MNFLAARAIFTFVFTKGTQPISILPENAVVTESNSYLMPTLSFLREEGFLSGDLTDSPALIQEVFEGGLGYELGLMSGDIISFINDQEVTARNIGTVLKANIGKEINVDIDR